MVNRSSHAAANSRYVLMLEVAVGTGRSELYEQRINIAHTKRSGRGGRWWCLGIEKVGLLAAAGNPLGEQDGKKGEGAGSRGGGRCKPSKNNRQKIQRDTERLRSGGGADVLRCCCLCHIGAGGGQGGRCGSCRSRGRRRGIGSNQFFISLGGLLGMRSSYILFRPK
jgi:hypothetical protein